MAVSTLQQITGVQSTDTINTALLLQFFNDSRRTVGAIRGGTWPWLEIERTVNTVANQDYVYIPNDMRKVTAVRVLVGTGTSATVYLPIEVVDIKRWQVILAYRLGSNQYPYFCYQQGQKLLLNPISSVTDTPVIMTGHRNIKDITIDDYITGSIVSIATAGTAMVGTGTTWTTSMAGRYIQIAESNTANKGDGAWYEILSVTDATHLTLVKPYQGTSISAGTAGYILGQITYEPEAYQMAPIYRAVAQYWDLKENMVLSERYWRLYDGGKEIGKADIPAGLIGQMLEEASETFDGGYLSPSDLPPNNYSGIPYWFPWQQGTGF